MLAALEKNVDSFDLDYSGLRPAQPQILLSSNPGCVLCHGEADPRRLSFSVVHWLLPEFSQWKHW